MFVLNIVFIFGSLIQFITLSNALVQSRNPFKCKSSDLNNTSASRVQDNSLPNKSQNKKQNEFVEAIVVNDAVKRLLDDTDSLEATSLSGLSPPYPYYNGSTVFDKLRNGTLHSKSEIPAPLKDIPSGPFNITHHQVLQMFNQTDKSALLSLYSKLAADFQVLQQYLADSTRKDCQKKCNECRANITSPTCTPKTTVEIKNVITLENISKDDGNFTRITLLKKKIMEKKRDVELPYFPCQAGTKNNIRLRITNQENDVGG